MQYVLKRLVFAPVMLYIYNDMNMYVKIQRRLNAIVGGSFHAPAALLCLEKLLRLRLRGCAALHTSLC